MRMKGVVYKTCVHSLLMYGEETLAMKVGVSEDASHRGKNAENDLQSEFEGK